jgi:hypothetical protein
MRKIAIFVEGQTELIVVREYLLRWFNYADIEIECRTLFIEGKFHSAEYDYPTPNPQYHFQIINVGNDNAVLSRILKREQYMWSAGYEKIIGLRDMYSKEYREMSTVINNEVNDLFSMARIDVINVRASKPNKIKMCFAIMETEAWFLGLHEALEKIHAELTNDFIFNKLGIDLQKIDPEKEVFHPASLLEKIYGLVGENYQKHKGDIEAFTHHFDRDAIEILLQRDKCNSFNVFHEAIHSE